MQKQSFRLIAGPVAFLAAITMTAAAIPCSAATPKVVVEEIPASQLLDELNTGKTTSEAIVLAYLDRINRIDRAGPALHSIITINPDALSQARQLDAERKSGKLRGPLHGLPVLIKDNIEEYGLSVAEAAEGLGVTRQQLYRVLRGENGISPEMAVRLEKAFGGAADFWLRMQMSFDLAQVRLRAKKIKVKPLEPKVA